MRGDLEQQLAAAKRHAERSESTFSVDLAQLDEALDADRDALYAQQRLTADTVEVSPRQLWQLLRQQQRAQASPRGLDNKSVLGLPLFSEGSRVVVWWGRAMMLIDLSYTPFYIPFTLALLDQYSLASTQSTAVFAIDAVFGFFFTVNLLLQLHFPVRVSATFYQLLVTNGRGVAAVYRSKGTLYIDLATALPWTLQLAAVLVPPASARPMMAVMLLLRLLRLVRVVRLVKMLARGELAPHSSRRLLSCGTWYVLSLAFCAVAVTNLIACAWYAVGRGVRDEYEGEGGEGGAGAGPFGGHGGHGVSWLSDVGGRDLRGADIGTQYLAAVYYTVTTITTTGYGDIVPRTNAETGVAIVIMVIGALFMSFIIGTVAALLNSGSADAQRSEAFRAKVAHLDRFFSAHPVARALEEDVYDYYFHVWSRVQQEQEEWRQVVAADLPSGLQGRLVVAVLRYSCRDLMQALGHEVPEAVMLALCSGLERHVLSPGTTLAVEGDAVDCLWLLRHGTVLGVSPVALVSPELDAFLCQDPAMASDWRQRLGQADTLARQRQQTARQRRAAVAGRGEGAAAGPPDGGGGSGSSEGSSGGRAGGGGGGSGGVWEPPPPAPSCGGGSGVQCGQAQKPPGLLKAMVGPCMFPQYALDVCTSGLAQQQQQQQQPQHPMWVRTEGMCVLFRADAELLRPLCQVCPTLRSNLARLLQ